MALTRPVSGCSSRVCPSSCASTPATSSADPAVRTKPRVKTIWPPGTAKALTSSQSSSTTRTDMGLLDAAAVRRWVRRLARLVLLGEGDGKIAPQRRARLLRHQLCHGLGRVQVEDPHARDEGEHGRHHAHAGPEPAQALAGGREGGGAFQELAGEGGIRHEQRMSRLRLQGQQHIGSLGAERHAAAQLAVGPQRRRQALGRAHLQAALAQAHLDALGVGRAAVAERARENAVRMRRH